MIKHFVISTVSLLLYSCCWEGDISQDFYKCISIVSFTSAVRDNHMVISFDAFPHTRWVLLYIIGSCCGKKSIILIIVGFHCFYTYNLDMIFWLRSNVCCFCQYTFNCICKVPISLQTLSKMLIFPTCIAVPKMKTATWHLVSR